jgi:hypothetical protein
MYLKVSCLLNRSLGAESSIELALDGFPYGMAKLSKGMFFPFFLRLENKMVLSSRYDRHEIVKGISLKGRALSVTTRREHTLSI